ncbi:hypothetical protein MMC10_004063 [Thelotrema lepadinum]|nr:hypothetical protein [Thelotrema lepadinum]
MDPTPDRCAQLRAHKVLPRSRVVSGIRIERDEAVQKNRAVSEPEKKDEEITSWMANTSPTTSNPTRYLPLTPPSLPHDENDSVRTKSPSLDNQGDQQAKQIKGQSATTPVNQNTPPTPELTPPHKHIRIPHDAHTNTSRFPSSASQADSFKTAQEYVASENGTTHHSSPNYDQISVSHGREYESEGPIEPSRRAMGAGVGLGLDLDERHSSSTMRTLKALQSPPPTQIHVNNAGSVVSDDPFIIEEPVAVREMTTQRLDAPSLELQEDARGQPVIPDRFQASLDRAFLLRDSIEEENSRSLKNSNKSTMSTPESLPVDSKRISQLSAGSSAVVEAVVISTPKRQRQKLRHSSKNASLREAGSPISGSNRSSLISNEAKPRLQHKAALPTANRHRSSLNSDSGISMGLDTTKDYNIAPSEVPQRKSSLKSKSRERAVGRQSASEFKPTTSHSRPMTAPSGATPQVIVTSPRLRSVSDLGSQAPPESRGRELRRSKPNIPARTSSLSASTNRNQSKPASLGAERHLQTAQQKQVEPSHTSKERQSSAIRDVPDISIERDEVEHDDNQRALQLRPSLTLTPFSALSGTSFQSLTPGPMELTEATAISIHPHNNKSLLVVQHSTAKESEQARTSAHFTNNVTVKLRSPSSSEEPVVSKTRGNCRVIPSRPAVMLIPPSPADAPPLEVNRTTLRAHHTKRASSGPLSTIRRAFSTRHHPDADVVPSNKDVPPSFNVPLRRRTRIGSASNALSPFWRPRGFWDDFSDDESAPEEEIGYVRNTLGMPQKRVITGPVALARRLGSLKRRKEARKEATETSTLSDGSFVGRHISMPSLRLRSRAGTPMIGPGLIYKIRHPLDIGNPFSSFYEGLLRKKAERDVARQDREKEQLKRSIGPVVPRAYASTYR